MRPRPGQVAAYSALGRGKAQKYRIIGRNRARQGRCIFGTLAPRRCLPKCSSANGLRGRSINIMNTEELKQDFESARIKHVHFKSKLRSYLFGNGGETGPLRDPEQCGLGLWIADRLRGRGAYAHLPEARQFDRKHVLIHTEANRLMDLHDAGQDDKVSAKYTQLQQMADEMVTLLQTMEAKLRTEA